MINHTKNIYIYIYIKLTEMHLNYEGKKKRKENKNADLQFKPDDEENIKDIKGTTDEI